MWTWRAPPTSSRTSPGRGAWANTPMLMYLALLLPGHAGDLIRMEAAEKACRMLGGDQGLIDQLKAQQQRVAGSYTQQFALEDLPAAPQSAVSLEIKALEMQVELARHEERKRAEEAPERQLRLAAQYKALLEDLGAFTVADRMAVQGMVRRAVAPGTVLMLQAPEQERFYTLSEYLEQVKHVIIPGHQLKEPGRRLAALYREHVREEPPTKLQEVNGRECRVKMYPAAHAGLMDRVIAEFRL